jgi:hypothetical protein
MENPFKPGDKVVAMRKGVEITAMVRTTWNHEVQIFTDTGELLWRTMKTVRREPVGEPEMAPVALSGEQVVPEVESHPPQEQSPAPEPETVEAESGAPVHVTEVPEVDLAEDDGAAPTEEAPETAPEEPAAAAPKSRKRRRGSRGEEGRSNRSRN